jgi:hypothetical protein
MAAPATREVELDVAAGSVPPSMELLMYYRRRIEEFETERAEFLRRFKQLEVRARLHLQTVARCVTALSPRALNWPAVRAAPWCDAPC